MSAAERKEETFTALGARPTQNSQTTEHSLSGQTSALGSFSFFFTHISQMRCPTSVLFILSCVLGSCVTSFHLLLSYVTWLCVSLVSGFLCLSVRGVSLRCHCPQCAQQWVCWCDIWIFESISTIICLFTHSRCVLSLTRPSSTPGLVGVMAKVEGAGVWRAAPPSSVRVPQPDRRRRRCKLA